MKSDYKITTLEEGRKKLEQIIFDMSVCFLALCKAENKEDWNYANDQCCELKKMSHYVREQMQLIVKEKRNIKHG